MKRIKSSSHHQLILCKSLIMVFVGIHYYFFYLWHGHDCVMIHCAAAGTVSIGMHILWRNIGWVDTIDVWCDTAVYACFRASYCAHVFVCVCNYWLLARLLAFNGTIVHMFHSYLHPTTDYAMEVRKKTTLVFEIKKQANCDYDYWNE